MSNPGIPVMRYHKEITRLTYVLAKAQQDQAEAEKAERLAAQRAKDCIRSTAEALSELMVELRRNGIEAPIVLPVAKMDGKVLVIEYGGGKATVLPILAGTEESAPQLTEA